MNNFIYIDGIAFWVVLGYLILQFIGFVIIGNSYLKSLRDNDLKDKQLKKLRTGYNLLIGEYHRATVKKLGGDYGKKK